MSPILLVVLHLGFIILATEVATTDASAPTTGGKNSVGAGTNTNSTVSGNGTDEITTDLPTTTTPAPTTVTPGEFPVGAGLVPCSNVVTHEGCNVTNFERCVLVRQRAMGCDCLPGYARARGGQRCAAVKYFWSELLTQNPYTEDLNDRNSAAYRMFEYHAREGLFQALVASDLRYITADVRVLRLRKSPSNTVIVDFEILVTRSYAPEEEMVLSDLQEGIQRVLVQEPSGGYRINLTDILVEKNDTKTIPITDPDPCSSVLLNHCDTAARCVAWERSYVCRCPEGYEDTSPNKLEAPGETCLLKCDCINGGVCKIDETGEKYCECSSWYIGSRCEIDGQLLLTVLAAVLGALFLIAIICSAICLWRLRCSKRKRVVEDDTSSVISLPRAKALKMPRSWMDTWRYFSFAQPQNYPAQAAHWPVRPQQAPLDVFRHPAGQQLMIPRPHLAVMPPHFPGRYRPEHWYWGSSYA